MAGSLQAGGPAPDLVYVCRDGANEELRYSLRSLRNLPHGRVWIVGGGPKWLSSRVERIPVQQGSTKWANSTENLRTACLHPDVSERFVLMNDDFFIMSRLREIPTLHRGPINAVIDHYRDIGNSPYLEGMERTRDLLAGLGIDPVLSYELHVPMVFTKTGVLEVLDLGGQPPMHTRTRFGNFHHVGGTETADVKVYDVDTVINGRLVSTEDSIFRLGAIGRRIRAKFRHPSPYETETDIPEMIYLYTNKSTGQTIEAEEPLPRLDALARWERTDRESGTPDKPADESPAETDKPTEVADVDADSDDDLDKPRGNASRSKWAAYALGHGVPQDEVDKLSRDELAARFK